MRVTESQLRRVVREELLRESRLSRKGRGGQLQGRDAVSQTRSLLERVLGVDALTPRPVTLIAGRPGNPGRMTDYQLLEVYFSKRRGLLTESHLRRVSVIAEGILDGIGSMLSAAGKKVGDFAEEFGKKMVDSATAAAKEVGENVKDVVAGVKDTVSKLGDFMAFIITKIPGGETIVTFVKEYAGKMSAIIKETQNYMKGKISGWAQKAKKWFTDYLINNLFDKHPELKKDVMEELGLTDKDDKEAVKENERLGIRNLSEFNDKLEHAFSKKAKTEAKTGDAMQAGNIGQQTLQFMNVLESDTPISGTALARAAAGAVLKHLLNAVVKICLKDNTKYKTYLGPLWDSELFEPFKTGYGLVSSALLGLASSSNVNLENVVPYVKGIMEGYEKKEQEVKATAKVGLEDADEKEVFAAPKLFMENGAKLLIDFLVGLIEGSNIEVIVRALAGDPSKFVDAGKRVMALIVNAIRAGIKAHASAGISAAVGSEAADETEDGILITLEKAVDSFFPS